MARWRVWLLALIFTVATAFLLFWILVHVRRPGWESQEYVAIVVWTVPLGLFVAGLAPGLRRRLAGRRLGLRPAALVGIAVAIAVTWMFIAVALTGGYALAFDANPLWCWTAGALAGLFAPAYWPARQSTEQPPSPAA
ncbi:MAG: hypothetical protein ABI120_07445 [Gemmatimonadaceae bacterium]